MQLAVPVAPAQHFERHPFKGMALANDRYVVGKIIEVVGSLSSSPSTGFIINAFWPASRRRLRIAVSCVSSG
jgi:hypothetical protein